MDMQSLIIDTVDLYKQFKPTEEQLSDFFGEFSCITRFERDIIDGEFCKVESMVSAQEEDIVFQAQKLMVQAPVKSAPQEEENVAQAQNMMVPSPVVSSGMSSSICFFYFLNLLKSFLFIFTSLGSTFLESRLQ
jgi:hypothetical protein